MTTSSPSSKHNELVNLCREAMDLLYLDGVDEPLQSRLAYELNLISRKELSTYFLMLGQLAAMLRTRKVPFNAGFGDAPGSFVLYLLGVTELDPLELGLVFERFFPVGHNALPSVHIAVPDAEQAEFNAYVESQYGKDNGELLTTSSIPDYQLAGPFMSIVAKTLANILIKYGLAPEYFAIPLDDDTTFKQIVGGATDGIYKLDNSRAKEIISALKPRCFADVIALMALLNEGVMEAKHDFIQQRQHPEPLDLPHPAIEKITAETHGVLLYREQLLQIAAAVFGISLFEADLWHRDLGKKKMLALENHKKRLLSAGEKVGPRSKTAEDVYAYLEKEAQYLFSKAHAANSALIAYRMAYLKAHYPAEFDSDK